ncbi:MAG: LCP family protein [Halanaerobiaceae bacterium]
MLKFTKKTYILVGLILFIIGAILAFLFNTQFSAVQNDPFSTSRLNILIVGYDSEIHGPSRADTIILTSIDLDTGQTGALFIPRDTRLEIPGYGKNRINAAHAFGGIELVIQTLEQFLNVPVDYYMETDFDGFARIIDTMGGIKINIEKPLHYVDRAGDLYIDLPAGERVLNGEEALQYVRYREETYGDIGRVRRQQKFIKSLMDKALSPEIIIKLPSIYKEVNNTVKTNIPFQDISPFLHLLKDMDLENIKTTMVPGEPKYINGASYWLADREELEIMVNKLIRSKEYIENSGYFVTIYNGNGEPGVASGLADELRKYGFNISKVANAEHFNYQTTIIKYFDSQDKSIVRNIQKLIGGKIKEGENNKGGVEIIIGADYLQDKGEMVNNVR